jgi:glutamyl-tRNA synthetase
MEARGPGCYALPVSQGYRGRFAPSPTGPMHLGLARTALLGWLRARSLGGTFVLRTEDIDLPRVVKGSAESILADLRWLGLDWDEGPDVGGPHAPYVQSERFGRYEAALEQLHARGLTYACTCSRKEVSLASAPHGPSEFGAPYPGTCRNGPSKPGGPSATRLRVPDVLPSFVEGLHGAVSEPVAQGDFVLRRADGLFSYQLAVVVDDIAMAISEVLRGDDLAGCTGWQLALYAALGAPAPAFVHVPLLLGPDGKRLAKRHASVALSSYRQRGIAAERVLGFLAHSAGLVPTATPVSARELVADFALDKIARAPAFVSLEALTSLETR